MKFKVDENLPVDLADLLIAASHDATTVHSEGLQGQTDAIVASTCRREERILITLDTDFANIYAYPPRQFPGFIVLRSTRQDKPHVLQIFQSVIPLLASESPEHKLWIVEEGRVRIRDSEPD
jgi:predicted nuclease of predicted toxin-antitoxin system